MTAWTLASIHAHDRDERRSAALAADADNDPHGPACRCRDHVEPADWRDA